MEKLENWTDKELIQVYDLQKKCAEKIIDFVRHGEESQVYGFLQIIPYLNSEYDWAEYEKSVFRRYEFKENFIEEKLPQGNYIYGELVDNWKGADNLREVFEDLYQWDFAVAHPTSLAIFAANQDIAREKCSDERYEKIRAEIPSELLDSLAKTISEYPPEIQEKAMREPVLGYTNIIRRKALMSHEKENLLEFQKVDEVTSLQSGDTIVGAYDLQMGLIIYQPELRGDFLTETVKNYLQDIKTKEIFEMVYGKEPTKLLKNADEEVVKLASQYDFVHTEEKIQVIENHKVCLFGTEEQKLKIPYERDPFCVSEKDYGVIMDALANKFEHEGFSKNIIRIITGTQNIDISHIKL